MLENPIIFMISNTTLARKNVGQLMYFPNILSDKNNSFEIDAIQKILKTKYIALINFFRGNLLFLKATIILSILFFINLHLVLKFDIELVIKNAFTEKL